MEFRFGGPLPVRFDLNGLMFSGVVVLVVGLLGWAGKWTGLYPPALHLFPGSAGEGLSNLTLADLFEALVLLGMVLYFLGRVVQVVAYLRRRS